MSSTMFLSPTMLSKPSNSPKPINPSNQQTHPTPNTNTYKNHNFNPNSSNSATKTAPWMKTPLLLEPNQVIDFTKPKNRNKSPNNNKDNKTLTQKVSGGRGKHAMKKILYSIDILEQETQETQKTQELKDTQKQKEFNLSLGELGNDKDGSFNKRLGKKLPWVREERMVFRRMKKEKTVTAAELSLDEGLLERLRNEARKMRSWVKVKKAGVNEGVVEQIRVIWDRDELAMVKFDVPLCRNMERAREIVEMRDL